MTSQTARKLDRITTSDARTSSNNVKFTNSIRIVHRKDGQKKHVLKIDYL